jgi:hypothetical protein
MSDSKIWVTHVWHIPLQISCEESGGIYSTNSRGYIVRDGSQTGYLPSKQFLRKTAVFFQLVSIMYQFIQNEFAWTHYFLETDLLTCSEGWSHGIIFTPNFVKIGQTVQKLKGTHTHKHLICWSHLICVFCSSVKKGIMLRKIMPNHA